jgi:hypothetical protein
MKSLFLVAAAASIVFATNAAAQTENPIDRSTSDGSLNDPLYRQTDPVQQKHVVPRNGPTATADAIQSAKNRAKAKKDEALSETRKAAQLLSAANADRKKVEAMIKKKEAQFKVMGLTAGAMRASVLADPEVKTLIDLQRQHEKEQSAHEKQASARMSEAKKLEKVVATSAGDYPYGTAPRTGR